MIDPNSETVLVVQAPLVALDLPTVGNDSKLLEMADTNLAVGGCGEGIWHNLGWPKLVLVTFQVSFSAILSRDFRH